MASKPTVRITTSGSQSDRRKLVTLYDQHRSKRFPEGRPWWGYAEIPAEAGHPWGIVGVLNPGNHERPFEDIWEAPWLPDAKWMQPNVERGTVQINYAGMVAEYTAATRKYYERCAEVAHDNKWVAPEFGAPVDSRFRAVVGRDIPQSPRIPQAAMAGDPWVLGHTTEINETLLKLLKQTAYGQSVQMMPTEPAQMTPSALPTSPAELQAMIASAVAEAMTAHAPDPAKVARAAKMREAKEMKKAQAQAQAA